MSKTLASGAAPFGLWERAIAFRYLLAVRKSGGVALVTIFAFVGIAMAVFALITVMSVMNGFRSELLDRLLGFNGHAYVAGGILGSPDRDAAVERIRKVPGVVRATPMIQGQVIVMGPAQITGAIVRGVSPSDVKATAIISGNIKRGSLDGYGQGEYGGDLVLIGDRMAAALGVSPGDPVTLISPTGATTAFGQSVNQKDYTVGGVFSVGMSEFDQAFIYMPLEQAQLFFGREGSVDKIEIMLKSADQAIAMKPALAQAAGPAAMVFDWTQENESFFNALQIERSAMRLILMILVAITTLNIIAGLVMMVQNKRRDIGILRTVGASQSAILRIFFMAGSLIGVLGAATGLVLGVVVCLNIEAIQQVVERISGAQVFNPEIYFLSHVPAKIEWSEVGLVTGWALFMSFVVTLLPAWLASRLDPVEALRYE
ncbi:MAG: lipoprotein-releasing ABC transporter permease subunit [Caulobacter sp.]|nr:lipoprotein-releasing ABC transporter permease subunit [Caulobacter sp.]